VTDDQANEIDAQPWHVRMAVKIVDTQPVCDRFTAICRGEVTGATLEGQIAAAQALLDAHQELRDWALEQTDDEEPIAARHLRRYLDLVDDAARLTVSLGRCSETQIPEIIRAVEASCGKARREFHWLAFTAGTDLSEHDELPPDPFPNPT